jgi:hypothetical protein
VPAQGGDEAARGSEWQTWPSNDIAKRCNVSNHMVDKIRAEIVAAVTLRIPSDDGARISPPPLAARKPMRSKLKPVPSDASIMDPRDDLALLCTNRANRIRPPQLQRKSPAREAGLVFAVTRQFKPIGERRLWPCYPPSGNAA